MSKIESLKAIESFARRSGITGKLHLSHQLDEVVKLSQVKPTILLTDTLTKTKGLLEKLEPIELKSPSYFGPLDCLKAGFKSKEQLALEYNTSEQIVQRTSQAIGEVRNYIESNLSNIVTRIRGGGTAGAIFKDGTQIEITEPYNMYGHLMTLLKTINVSNSSGEARAIHAFAHKNDAEAFNLFEIFDRK